MFLEYVILICLSGHPQDDLVKTEYLKQNYHVAAAVEEDADCYYTKYLSNNAPAL